MLCGPVDAPALQPTGGHVAGVRFDQVLLRVRQEVALFAQQSTAARSRDLDLLRGEGIEPRCAEGASDFAIRRVSLTLAVAMTPGRGGEAEMTVPFAEAGDGPRRMRTAVLDDAWEIPAEPDARTARLLAPVATIAPVMSGLRHGLLRATMQVPCSANVPGGIDGTLAFALRVERDADPSVGFHLAIAPMLAGAEVPPGSVDTVTIGFHAPGSAPAPVAAPVAATIRQPLARPPPQPVPMPPVWGQGPGPAGPGTVYVPLPGRRPGVVEVPLPDMDMGSGPGMVPAPGSSGDPGSTTQVD